MFKEHVQFNSFVVLNYLHLFPNYKSMEKTFNKKLSENLDVIKKKVYHLMVCLTTV
jgi:hypothetical protein